MEADKLKKIIDRENERAEERAENHAQEIIRQIIREQSAIVAHEQAIAELRKELKALSVTTLDHSSVIGE